MDIFPKQGEVILYPVVLNPQGYFQMEERQRIKCCAAQGVMDSAVINSNHPTLDLFRNFQEYGNIYF